MRRTTGERTADLSLFLAAIGFAVVTADPALQVGYSPGTFFLLNHGTGGLACAALFLRRRRPVQLAVVLLAAGAFSYSATGAAVIAVFTVAAERSLRTTAWVAALAFAPLPYFAVTAPGPDDPGTGAGITYFVLLAGAFGGGLCVRSRQQLVALLRERADQAHAEARRQAREDIAREMHDVLAHRLSLLSVHAGALHFNPGAPEEEIQRTAGVIRACAHEALEDLREIIGVLRASSGEGARPQPVLADLMPLVEESRTAGMRVGIDVQIAGGGAGGDATGGGDGEAGGDNGDGEDTAAVPAVVGRTVYRVVQEGLTNARKHAPDSRVEVTVGGGPAEGLTVRVSNPLPPGADAAAGESGPFDAHGTDPARALVPGAGQGLVGLAERARLVGGRLEHEQSGGEFRLLAWLPWSARPAPGPGLAAAAAPSGGTGTGTGTGTGSAETDRTHSPEATRRTGEAP